MMLAWSTEMHRKSLCHLMALSVKGEGAEEKERQIENGGRRGKRGMGGKEKWQLVGWPSRYIGDREGSVSAFHPQWELRPAGCVAFFPHSIPPPTLHRVPGWFLQWLNVALCSREAPPLPAHMTLVGSSYGDKQLAQHWWCHTRCCLSYTAMDLGTHTHGKRPTKTDWADTEEQKRAFPPHRCASWCSVSRFRCVCACDTRASTCQCNV